MDYHQADFGRNDYLPFDTLPPRPKHFEEMKRLTRDLSKGVPILRIDFYEINDAVYFSKLTFYPGAGFTPFDSPEWEKRIGEMLKLPRIQRDDDRK